MDRIKAFTIKNEMPDVEIKQMEEVETTNISNFNAKVILFNDDVHTFDEVAEQIVKAINCTYNYAMDITNDVHVHGKAVVYDGDMAECLNVSAVLEEIHLRTQIECYDT